MIISQICAPNLDRKERRRLFNEKKLEVLSIYKDSLERRIAAISASIDTLEQQISRDADI